MSQYSASDMIQEIRDRVMRQSLTGLRYVFRFAAVKINDGVIVMMSAVWLVIMGIVTIVTSINITKNTGSKMWILQLIFGIIAIILGGYSFFHPMVMAVSLGFLISIYFIETGFTMMFGGFSAKEWIE